MIKKSTAEEVENGLLPSKYYTDESIREKIDKLLAKNAALEASLGKDSSTKEIVNVKIKQERLFNQIKKLDEIFYDKIITDND